MNRGLLIVLVLTALPLEAASVRSLVQDGNAAYERSDYDEALSAYSQAAMADPNSPYAAFNRGAALYRKADHAGAVTAFSDAALKAREAGDPSLTAAAEYNLGNSLVRKAEGERQGNPQDAIESLRQAIGGYRAALEKDPGLTEAGKNLEAAKGLLRQVMEQMRKQPQKGGQGESNQDMAEKLRDQLEKQKDVSDRSEDEAEKESSQDGEASDQAEQLAQEQEQLEQQSKDLSQQMKQDPQQSSPEQQQQREQAQQQLDQAAEQQGKAAEQLGDNDLKNAQASQQKAEESLQQALDALQGKQQPSEDQQPSQAEGRPQQAPPQQSEAPRAQALETTPEDILNREQQDRKQRRMQMLGKGRKVEKDW